MIYDNASSLKLGNIYSRRFKVPLASIENFCVESDKILPTAEKAQEIG